MNNFWWRVHCMGCADENAQFLEHTVVWQMKKSYARAHALYLKYDEGCDIHLQFSNFAIHPGAFRLLIHLRYFEGK